MKKTFVLDVHKWRSGEETISSIGLGETALNNEYGYMCCLGQVENQCGITKNKLINLLEPKDSGKDNFLTKLYSLSLINSELSIYCMKINDNDESVSSKLKKIKSRFKKDGYDLVIKNDSAFRRNGSINWKFISDTYTGLLINDHINDLNNVSYNDIESTNKYFRQAIRKVGLEKFKKNVSRYLKKTCL